MPVKSTIRAAAAVATAAAAIALGESPAYALGHPDYVGRVGLVAATYCPIGTLEANGRELSVRQEQILFSLIGNTYGGDSSKETFALPDLRDKVPAKGLLYCIVVDGLYPPKSAAP